MQLTNQNIVFLKELMEEDPPELQQLLERCADFLIFQDEKPVASDAALELFRYLPEGADSSGKLIMGIFTSAKLIGVFELIKGYSGPSVLNLSLMLIDPQFRGKGMGQLAYFKVEEWAAANGFTKTRLGVLFGNNNGFGFWKRVGYNETGEIKPYLSNKFRVMEKDIR